MLIRRAAVVAVGALVAIGVAPTVAGAATVPLTLSASIGSTGITVTVQAPGCEPTPPGAFDIVVQGHMPTGEVGEGAVALGRFEVAGQGTVLIPAGTAINEFLLTVSCNGGALTGSQVFVFGAPVAVPGTPNFTGCPSGRRESALFSRGGLEVALVLCEVVAPAAELEVVEVGWAVADPVDDVVGVAPVAGDGASVFHAGAVADLQCPSLGWGDEASAAADVEDFGFALHHDPPDGGVAGQGLEVCW